ncbi:MAG: biotin--[acetyl-CoA-carboxylase] ligase [Sandaracinaceae bacterium]|nr:biotin--[acetyl-CoA-carboxylase] ligase [Sandaracinaceae bacterium]
MSVAELERARERLERGARVYGRSLEILALTGSTNDDARAAAERGAPRGHVVVADAQRAGRGARGSVWSSPGGTDLYVSIVERVSLAPRALSVLTLAVALGVRDARAELLAAGAVERAAIEHRVRVKWPNDVLLDGRKCAGILVESSSIGERLGPIVIGIGLDVNRDAWPPELGSIATSLRAASGRVLDRAEVLVRLLGAVESRVDALVQGGPEGTVRALRERLALLGERVEIDATRGTLEGLDDDGALLVRRDDGTLVTVRSGMLRSSREVPRPGP